MGSIKLTIDGKAIEAKEGFSILEVCRQNHIIIPTLCHLADLTPEGACRICLVEVTGARGLVASCNYPAVNGMEVITCNAAIREARKMNLELLLANHPQECLSCQRNMNCELQSLAAQFGIDSIPWQGEKRQAESDAGNPFVVRDPDKCILCGRCVRVTREIQCCNVLEMTQRGFQAKVTTAFDSPLTETNCVFCGTCVSACPTAALTEKPMRDMGLAERKVKTTCPFCGVGCNFDLNVKDNEVIGVTSNLTAPVNGRLTCVKGRFGTDYIHSPERLKTPLIKKNGQFVEASWEEALSLTAEKFSHYKSVYGSDSIAALSSARCTIEENYLIQKLMRAVIGTNHIDHCART